VKPEGLLGGALWAGMREPRLGADVGLRAHESDGGKDYQKADHEDRESEHPQELCSRLYEPPYDGPDSGNKNGPYHDEREIE
jgi:hypothetical protein